MPFELYVVDNGSDAEFLAKLEARFRRHDNFHLIPLRENLFCGPATNVGASCGASDYIFYICSKEGFILKHGWEIEAVRQMDANPDAALGGHLIPLPNYSTGKDIASYGEFQRFRNKSFALENPNRPIRHVQGGFMIFRRSAYEAIGGFSYAVPQSGTDVEYSFYLESAGYELLELNRIKALSIKTWPNISTLMDEHVQAIHPASVESVEKMDGLARRTSSYCGLCDWAGPAFIHDSARDDAFCPRCGSSRFSRTAWRILSHIGVLQTRPQLVGHMMDRSLKEAADRVCDTSQVIVYEGPLSSSAVFFELVVDRKSPPVLLLDHLVSEKVVNKASIKAIIRLVKGGVVVIAGESALTDKLSEVLAKDHDGVLMDKVRFKSEMSQYAWRDVFLVVNVDSQFAFKGLN